MSEATGRGREVPAARLDAAGGALMSADPLMRHVDAWFEELFPLDQAPALQELIREDEDSPLALDERTNVLLSNGDMLEFDLYQTSGSCWTAKGANHDGRTGGGNTLAEAIADLVSLAEDDIEDSDLEEPR